MKDKVKIRYVFIGLAFVAVVGWWLQTKTECVGRDKGLGGVTRRDGIKDDSIHLPSPLELQEELVRRGYDIGTDGADGIIGPNTVAGWDKYVCDRFAKEYFE